MSLLDPGSKSEHRIPLLKEGNYNVWAMLMEATLVAADLWEVVDKDNEDFLLPKGAKGVAERVKKKTLAQARILLGIETSQLPFVSVQLILSLLSVIASSLGVTERMKKKTLARARILLGIETFQLPFVSGMESPREMWLALAKIHRSSSVNSILALRRRFFSLCMEADESIISWISRVRALSMELQFTKAPMSDLDIILAITIGLPAEYGPIITILDNLFFEDLTIAHITNCLTSFKSQLNIAHIHDESIMLARCWNCNGIGHGVDVCPSKKNCDHIQENKDKGKKKITSTSANEEPQYELARIAIFDDNHEENFGGRI
ncbi:hypothetical protein CVT24_012247, partial [Panaeolus cyanescens]